MTMTVPNGNAPRAGRTLIAREKMRAIMPLLRPRGINGGWTSSDGLEFPRKSDLVRHIAEQLGVAEATVWRWQAQFQAQGFQGLTSTPRSDRGRSRFFRKNGAAAIFIEYRMAAAPTNAHALHQTMLREFAGPIPDLKTLRRYLRDEFEARQ